MDCNMNWISPIWEPKWLSIIMAKENHDDYHAKVINPYTNPIAIAWMELERERIIKVLRENEAPQSTIALIKAEN